MINVAGISRPTDIASGSETDWAAVLEVHLGGYLNVLDAALPRMATAGHGRVLGVTSGSGWRPANAGSYGCAKRAVDSLTWQIGRVAPPAVTVNALSPIAETRMVTAARDRSGAADPGGTARSGGISLAVAPPPEHLGPIGAYLASESFAWANGEVIFSNGAEAAWLTPPRLLEVCRSSDAPSLPHLLDTVVPIAFTPGERAQATNGRTNPRFADVFNETRSPGVSEGIHRCAVITDDGAWGRALSDALLTRGVTCVGLGAADSSRFGGKLATDFADTASQLAMVAQDGEPFDAVVVALLGAVSVGGAVTDWAAVLAEHAEVPALILRDAAWARAVTDYAGRTGRPVRLVSLIDATSSGGRSRAQAAIQLARSARSATSEQVTAFAVSVESSRPSACRTAAELAAHLLCVPDAGALCGAELLVEDGWFGLSSHPTPATSISYGGPALPDWFDTALRNTLTGHPN